MDEAVKARFDSPTSAELNAADGLLSFMEHLAPGAQKKERERASAEVEKESWQLDVQGFEGPGHNEVACHTCEG